jgi:hypothetical protein
MGAMLLITGDFGDAVQEPARWRVVSSTIKLTQVDELIEGNAGDSESLCGARLIVEERIARPLGSQRVCANRILVQDGLYDAFTKRLAETAGAMKVADGFEPGAAIGPLIDMKAVEKVEAHIAVA